MCYILCTSSSVCALHVGRRGVRGGAVQGGESPSAGVRGKCPDFFFFLRKRVTYLGGFSAHGFLPMVFYFRLRN
jgi:hypothetical protein